jgi:DNA topoisomerase VI subunit B
VAVQLQRTHFSTGRAAEYFDAKELAAQTGRPRHEFAAAVLKELVDNALDAAETAGIAPEVRVTIDRDGDDIAITVADNGPGLAPEVVKRILDFETRTSDKSRYRAPTRGAQGNALKTVVGIPTALGGTHPITVESRGVRHAIRPKLDAAGYVDVGHTVDEVAPTDGTTVTVTLPAFGQELSAYRWADAFALANPHADLSVRIRDASRASNGVLNPASTTPPFFTDTRRPSGSRTRGRSGCRPTRPRRTGTTAAPSGR